MQQALRQARADFETAHHQLVRLQNQLRDVSAKLPTPEYDDESGEPTNLAAAWQLGLTAHVSEQIDSAERWLSRAVHWTESNFGGPID